MQPSEHYLAALHAIHQAKHKQVGHTEHLGLMAMAQAHAVVATAGAALLSAGVEKLPELEFDDNGILAWRRSA